ncbi:MAG: undecaprenyl-diphosphatase UppP [Bdellovibrionota bacterium]
MDSTSPIYALILGIIQGLTEFLPVSSSGHLVVVSWFMNGKSLPLSLNIVLHIGTLSAVLLYFWKSWLGLGLGIKNRILKGTKSFESEVLLPSLILGSVPAGVVGLLWKDSIQSLFHNPLSVAVPLVIVGILLWQVDIRARLVKRLDDLTVRDGLLIGVAQAFSLIPGVSRSGITTMAGRQLGFDREAAARFSFLLGTPAMGGAAVLYGKELLAHATDPVFLIGAVVSCLVGCIAIKFFLSFIKRFGFGVFAIYRCVLAAVILYLLYQA